MKTAEYAIAWKIKHLFSFNKVHFMYIDSPDYYADRLFINNKVTIHFKEEYANDDNPKYRIIFAYVHKKDAKRAIEALKLLPNKMFLMGNKDYLDFCKFIEDNCNLKDYFVTYQKM